MKKILFVTLDEFSNINPSLEKQLTRHFPEHELQSLQLKTNLKKNSLVLFFSVLAVFNEYFFDFLLRRKKIESWRKYLYHTPYIMRYFNREIDQQLRSEKYEFVFQTQSVFDSSSKYAPNFIYIDHTNLNNLNYTLINAKEYLCSDEYVRLETCIYKNATLLFVMSLNMKESLVSQYGINPEKVKLVHVGSNSEINDEIDQTKYSNKNILFVGKDWERKGGPLLIEAFKIVQKEIPDATLTIIGCTPSVNVNNCFIAGDISLNEVAQYYKKASVFCLPTKREPFGVVFIEAMLNRLAIVTNDVGATPELVVNNENGFRLKYDAAEYARTLIKLLKDPDLCKSFGEYSYQIAKQTYTWNYVGELFSNNINEALKNRSTSELAQTSA
jgi:glycosyltransferase involved in cell wall biosynthesis